MTKSKGLLPRLNAPSPMTVEWLLAHTTESSNGCREWNHARTTAGYGHITIAGKVCYTHRVMCALVHGSTEHRAEARHTCDNPPCINPDHLNWGSHGDNMRDAQSRGRLHNPGTYHGTRHHSSKITYEIAQQIRAEYAVGGVTLKDLGHKYGLDFTSIHAIVKWRTWRFPEGATA